MRKKKKISNRSAKETGLDASEGIKTTIQRSKLMSRIKSKNTAVEILLRKELWNKNIRYRIHNRNLPGTPDLVFEKYKLVVFIDGGFWHGYNWAEKKIKIKTNRQYWIPKIERNIERDKQINSILSDLGYNVMRFWEHQVKQNLPACVNQIRLYIEAAKTRRLPNKEDLS